jgi:DNA-directed RNA polymerase specialized sigma24 family protein
MIEAPTKRAATADSRDRLGLLIDRIAAGDRAAFRSLYAFLAVRILRDAIRELPHAADARAVTWSTFAEVWHLAGDHVGQSRVDTRVWIATIAARRIEERLRNSDPQRATLDDYDSHVHRELAALLGAGPNMIRTSTANFARTDSIDRDLVP